MYTLQCLIIVHCLVWVKTWFIEACRLQQQQQARKHCFLAIFKWYKTSGHFSALVAFIAFKCFSAMQFCFIIRIRIAHIALNDRFVCLLFQLFFFCVCYFEPGMTALFKKHTSVCLKKCHRQVDSFDLWSLMYIGKCRLCFFIHFWRPHDVAPINIFALILLHNSQ